MENISTNVNISENNKQIIKSVAPFVIVILLFFVVGKFGIAQITGLRDKISTAKKTESVLSQKYNVLKSVAVVAASGSNQTLAALPKDNPAVMLQSQVKSIAASNLLVIDSLKSVGVSSTSDLSSVTTTVELNGPKDAIIAFIRAMDTIAPITTVDKVSFSETGASVKAEIGLRTYYAPLPKTIPTVTQPVVDLTASEKALLTQISSLTQPTFSDILVATQSALNPDPFGQ